jgi:hypothetical protein
MPSTFPLSSPGSRNLESLGLGYNAAQILNAASSAVGYNAVNGMVGYSGAIDRLKRDMPGIRSANHLASPNLTHEKGPNWAEGQELPNAFDPASFDPSFVTRYWSGKTGPMNDPSAPWNLFGLDHGAHVFQYGKRLNGFGTDPLPVLFDRPFAGMAL